MLGGSVIFYPQLRGQSPSIVKEYRMCPRRMAFKRFERKKDPVGPAAHHGSAMHKQLELYGLRGQRPTHAHALAVVPHAPRPLTAMTEHEIKWQFNHLWSYLGILDFSGVLLSRAKMETSPFIEPGAHLLIGDYKFTSNLKYALEVHNGLLVDRETLQPDPQSTMYAAKYMLYDGFEKVTGKWIYTRTTSTPKVVPVWVDFDKGAVADEMGKIDEDCASIHELYQIRPKGNDVRFKLSGCRAFNKPCPHISYCELPARRVSFDADEGDTTMGFADDIMRDFPTDEDELPPLDDGEELPPLDDDVIDREAEDAAAIEAEIVKQRAERGTTEKSFVNAPEAPDTAPKDPDEAFEQHGDPVVEKPKKEKAPKAPKPKTRKFGAKDKKALMELAVEKGLVEKETRFSAAGLAKMLKEAGHDPEALLPSNDVIDTTGVEIISQEGVTEEELPLIDEDELPDIDAQEEIDGIIEEVTEAWNERAIEEKSYAQLKEEYESSGAKLAADMTKSIAEAQAAGLDTSEVEAELARSAADKAAAYALPVKARASAPVLSSDFRPLEKPRLVSSPDLELDGLRLTRRRDGQPTTVNITITFT